ncbi:MAG: hypothetical protein LBH97_03965 [Treponema sp.]|jgi:hypothetical protein|nr:hypothetical protein [Treponema sp.]
MNKARQPELVNKIFTGDDGDKYEGERFITVSNPAMPSGMSVTRINYHQGKIHGTPAIVYPDGLEESWEHGTFTGVYRLPYAER